jgi:predicted PurR-regulated permease PerM
MGWKILGEVEKRKVLNDMNDYQDENFFQGTPAWLRGVGVQSWLFIGVILAAAVIFSFMSALNQIVTSLIISLLLAILSRPLVDWLEHHKVTRSLGAILTLVLILLGLIVLVVIMAEGVIQQGPEIADQVQTGWLSLQVWLADYHVQLPSVDVVMTTIQDALPAIFAGVFGFVGSTVSTLLEVFVGLYFSVFILFFLLRDIVQIEGWIAGLISREHEVGASIVQDVGRTVRVYFRGTALTALITSAVVAIPLIVLKVPLVGSILILYFVTSFIPYLGAWIAGVFAVLIALGSGGIGTAWIVLTAVIISNGAIQTAVNSWALGSMLKLHPLLIFLVTIIAGMVGGVVLMILAVPLTAIVIQVVGRLRQARMITK